MPYFDADFAAADELFSEAFSESVVYIAGGGARTTDEQAIVDPETRKQVTEDRSRGKSIVRERMVSLRRSVVDTPQLNGLVEVDGEEWPIVGYAGRDALRTRVILQLTVLRGRSVQGH